MNPCKAAPCTAQACRRASTTRPKSHRMPKPRRRPHFQPPADVTRLTSASSWGGAGWYDRTSLAFANRRPNQGSSCGSSPREHGAARSTCGRSSSPQGHVSLLPAAMGSHPATSLAACAPGVAVELARQHGQGRLDNTSAQAQHQVQGGLLTILESLLSAIHVDCF